jgi:hypothetical protein
VGIQSQTDQSDDFTVYGWAVIPFQTDGIRFHLMKCVFSCRRYRKQLLAIRALLRMEQEDAGTAALSHGAGQRLEEKIKEAVAKVSEFR